MPLDLTSLTDALRQLEQVTQREEDEEFMAMQDDITRQAIRAGVIQHFEIVYELCWKFIQRWLRINGTPDEAEHLLTRKDLFRLAARYGLIDDPQPWFEFGDARNLTLHTYNAAEADAVLAQAMPLAHAARSLLDQLNEVQRILHAHVPDYRVCAFGSRVTGTAGRFSDLDLVVMGDQLLSHTRLSALKEAFSASNLPFMVDVLDWASTAEYFRRILAPQLAVVHEAQASEIS